MSDIVPVDLSNREINFKALVGLLKDFPRDSSPNASLPHPFPPFNGDYNLLQDVSQHNSYFSTPQKPVLATCSLSTCVGIVAYDLSKRFAFLAHSDSFSVLYRGGDKLDSPSTSSHIARLNGHLYESKEKYDLSVRIVTGDWPYKSLLDLIMSNLQNMKFHHNISSIDIQRIENCDNIGIDSRTAEMFLYNPRLNPNPKDPCMWDSIFLKSK